MLALGCGELSLAIPNMRKRPCSEHPVREIWASYLRNELAPEVAETMDYHLDHCHQCAELIGGLPPPPYHCLGRPLPDTLFAATREIEASVNDLLGVCRSRVGPVVVAGDAWSERMLYTVLAVSQSRMKRSGLSVSIRGALFDAGTVPVRTRVDVGFLLEAPAYPDLGEWLAKADGKLNLLVGHAGDWRARGIRPDYELYVASGVESTAELERIHRAVAQAWSAGGEQERLVLQLAAASVDAPVRLWKGEVTGPFALVHDVDGQRRLEWMSVNAGPWLTREALRRIPDGLSGGVELWKQVRELAPEIEARFRNTARFLFGSE